MQCPRCQHENPTTKKLCGECGTPLRQTNASGAPGASYADLQRALSESLDQQTATSEILRVISSSPTDVQPVFDTIVRSALRLCNGATAAVFRMDGGILHHPANYGGFPEALAAARARYPRPVGMDSIPGIAILTRSEYEVRDTEAPAALEMSRETGRILGIRSLFAVPILREDDAVGAIVVTRREPGGFAASEISLLKTFADQAVIALENVRLFKKLEARNRDLTAAHPQVTETLEQQTATSEILRTIAHAHTDVQPVFDTIVRSAARLCHAAVAAVFLTDGRTLYHKANYGGSPEARDASRALFPRALDTESAAGVAILTQSVVHVPDTEEPSALHVAREAGRRAGFRSLVSVPMLRQGDVIGAISVNRREPGRFSEGEVELLKTFADQAVIAIENARLFSDLQVSNRELTIALDQQTATADVLRVIGSSPTDAQPVFEAIGSSARRLLSGFGGAVYRVAGDEIHLAAYISTNPSGDAALRSSFPRPLAVFSPPGEAIRGRAPVVLTDVDTDGWVPDDIRELIRKRGDRSGVWVPMMREGEALGAIGVTRSEPGSFRDEQIELLKTFADQAVIAIQNVRLFTELGARNHDLTEALDQQTATGEILRVISSSPTDLGPVMDAVAENAARLCDASDAQILRADCETIILVASYGSLPTISREPRPISQRLVGGRAIIDRVTLHIPDVTLVQDEFPDSSTVPLGVRTALAIPLLREGTAIGAIMIRRMEVRPFSDKQVALLQTFADQAVIAIENVRLFKELEARNRDLTVALEQQTATSEILRVISQSPTDVQPVFDTIMQSAVRLCGARIGVLYRFDGELLHLAAHHNLGPDVLATLLRLYPMRPNRETASGRAILGRAVAELPDALADPEYRHEIAIAGDWRSMLAVPMLREGEPIGTIVINRSEPGAFPESQIALLQTFADQAVIAIENVRLFKELEARTGELTQSVEKLTALGEVSRAVSSTLDVETVLDTIVSRACQLAGAAGCSIYEYDEGAEQFELRATHNYDAEFVEALRAAPLRKGEGLMGRAAEMREPIQVPDITQPGAYQSSLRDTLIRFGYRALLSVPLLRENQIIGSLSFNRKAPGEFPPEVVDVLKTFATQSALAIQNARLFREIADKSAQLEAASRHKSEFLANMSHELRTPLNAIIGFSEVLAQGMFGAINEKQTEYLHDILESGRHLLSLINDILDLSKIEAGRMELEASEFNLPQAIENALTLVRERALRRGIALHHVIDDRVAEIRADERKVKQVLLNLLSNAIKFTPEGGRIELRAVPRGGTVEVSVTDTGVGIAPEDQEAVFEEFRQVGASDKKAEGTGLGLALSRKFIELHGGKIHVTSQVGVGSTFTFTLPIR
jgi:GAF domain-containing protein